MKASLQIKILRLYQLCDIFCQLPVKATHASMVNVWRPSTATCVNALQVFMEKSVSKVRNCTLYFIVSSCGRYFLMLAALKHLNALCSFCSCAMQQRSSDQT